MTSSRIRIAALLSSYNLYFFFFNFLKFFVSRNLIESKKNVRCIFFFFPFKRRKRRYTPLESNAWFIAQGRTIYNTTKGRKIGKRTVTFFFFFVYLQLSTSCPSSLIFPNKFPLGREFHRKKRFFFGSPASNWIKKDQYNNRGGIRS